MTALYRQNPSRAFATMIEHEETLRRDPSAGGYAKAFYRWDSIPLPELAEHADRELPEGPLRNRFMASIGTTYLRRNDHNKAWNWWQTLSPEDRSPALQGLVSYKSKIPKHLTEEVRQAVTELDHPTTSLSLIRATGYQWAAQDREAAVAFIQIHVSSRQRNKALRLLDEKPEL